MQKQHCEFAVKQVLDNIGNNNILLQCDGYESFLNALATVDTKGQIRELVSPGDCSDLCSMPDCEVGAFITKKVDKEFEDDYQKRVDDYVSGKVTARNMRVFYTHAIDRAVSDLYKNHKDMVKRAFQKTGVLIDINGYDKHLIRVPNFLTYKPPEYDEELREDDFTKEEIKQMEKREVQHLEQEKSRRPRKRKSEQKQRNQKRAKECNNFCRR